MPNVLFSRLKLLQIALTSALLLTPLLPANAAEQRVWQPNITSEADWQRLSKPEHDAEFTKFVLDVKTGKMYYVDSNVFNLHIDFGLGVLLKQPRKYETIKAFN